MIHSDFHIHSEFSYDAKNTLAQIIAGARAQGLRRFGITDHLNFNDEAFMGDLKASSENVLALKDSVPEMLLGVELTTIPKPIFDHIAKTGTREGYIPPASGQPYAMAVAADKATLMRFGVRYAIGAAHWRTDGSDKYGETDVMIRDWHRQQLWLSCHEAVTVLGHPWYNGRGAWYEDFSCIPASMHEELAAALRENGKYVECNPCMLTDPRQTDTFRRQYAEFLRFLFESGVSITYGSDSHSDYGDCRPEVEEYLAAAGFREGDFSEIAEEKLW